MPLAWKQKVLILESALTLANRLFFNFFYVTPDRFVLPSRKVSKKVHSNLSSVRETRTGAAVLILESALTVANRLFLNFFYVTPDRFVLPSKCTPKKCGA